MSPKGRDIQTTSAKIVPSSGRVRRQFFTSAQRRIIRHCAETQPMEQMKCSQKTLNNYGDQPKVESPKSYLCGQRLEQRRSSLLPNALPFRYWTVIDYKQL